MTTNLTAPATNQPTTTATAGLAALAAAGVVLVTPGLRRSKARAVGS